MKRLLAAAAAAYGAFKELLALVQWYGFLFRLAKKPYKETFQR